MKRSTIALLLALMLFPSIGQAEGAKYLKDRSFSLPGKEGPNGMQDPVGIGVSTGGTVYVLDARGKICAFSERGEPQHCISSPLFSRLLALAVAPSGDLIVLNGQSRKLHIVSPEGDVRFSFGGGGDKAGQLSSPVDLSVGADGLIYVLDAERKGVEVFSADGLFIRQILMPELLPKPCALAVGPDGMIYLADKTIPGSLYRLPPFDQIPWLGPVPAKLVTKVSIPGGASPNQTAMAVNANGTILLLDGDLGKVFRHRPDAAPNAKESEYLYGGLGASVGSFQKPVALALASVDEVVILDSAMRKVERIRLTGESDLKPLEHASSGLHIGFGSSPELTGTLLALDADSIGVRGFFFDRQGKSVVQKKAERSLFRAAGVDTAKAFNPSSTADETVYSQEIGSVGAAAVRDTLVAVTDPDHNRVVLLREGTAALIGTVGDEFQDERKFHKPAGVAITPDERIVVADLGSNMLRILSDEGASVNSVPFLKPFGLVTDPAGTIYLWDSDGSKLSRARPDHGFEELTGSLFPVHIGGLSFDQWGNAFALDLDSQQILILDKDRKSILLTFGPAGRYEDPSGLFTDPVGNIYLADRKTNVTHVFHWSLQVPAAGDLSVVYHVSGASVSWPPVTSKYLWGYQVCGKDDSGKIQVLRRQRGTRYELAAPDSGGARVQSLWVVPISISGTNGASSATMILPGLSAMAAVRKGDIKAPAVDQTWRQLQGGSSVQADSGVVIALQLARFFNACADKKQEVILRDGPGLRRAVPASRQTEYHRCLTEAYLGAGKRDQATAELLAVAGDKPSPSLLSDSTLVEHCFRIYEAGIAAGDTLGALRNLRSFAGLFADSVARKAPLFGQRMVAAEARIKLARGVALWNSHDLKGTKEYFERVLVPGTVQLEPEEKVLISQILAAVHFAQGKLQEAKLQYIKTFALEPDFQLARQADRVQRYYRFSLYSPEMLAFFGAIHPPAIAEPVQDVGHKAAAGAGHKGPEADAGHKAAVSDTLHKGAAAEAGRKGPAPNIGREESASDSLSKESAPDSVRKGTVPAAGQK